MRHASSEMHGLGVAEQSFRDDFWREQGAEGVTLCLVLFLVFALSFRICQYALHVNDEGAYVAL